MAVRHMERPMEHCYVCVVFQLPLKWFKNGRQKLPGPPALAEQILAVLEASTFPSNPPVASWLHGISVIVLIGNLPSATDFGSLNGLLMAEGRPGQLAMATEE